MHRDLKLVVRFDLQGIIGHIVERGHFQFVIIRAGRVVLTAGASALREARNRRGGCTTLGAFLDAWRILFEQLKPLRQVIRQIGEV
ncbi:MAG: hypothetical protein SH809_07885 [Rhodothermales bacterium]|nr:hypothetical protein [Rhodothermales bacterium]